MTLTRATCLARIAENLAAMISAPRGSFVRGVFARMVLFYVDVLPICPEGVVDR